MQRTTKADCIFRCCIVEALVAILVTGKIMYTRYCLTKHFFKVKYVQDIVRFNKLSDGLTWPQLLTGA